MADITYLPPEPAVPEVPGGRTRASVLVDLERWPAVQRRRELNERLLAGTCGIDGDERRVRFDREDLELLLLVTRERFGGRSALLRHRAVQALGAIDDGAAVECLTDLALSPVEVDGIRITALGALGPERARELLDELAEHPSPSPVRDHARRLRGDSLPERFGRPRQVPRDSAHEREHGGGPRSGCCC